MGVFLYSNKTINTEKIERVFHTRGHKEIVNHKISKGTLLSSKKVIVDNENYLSTCELNALGGGSSDFAVGIGTYCYKGKYGKEALKSVYLDLDYVLSENPIYGHWAFCIHKGGHTYIFNDMNGTLRLYVHQQGDKVVISSSELAVMVCMENFQFDIINLSAFLTETYASEIPFLKNIDFINARYYYDINENDLPEIKKRNIPPVPRIEDFTEAKNYVKALLKEQAEQLIPIIGKKTVYADATGGLDSRLIACFLKHYNVDFDYINYPIYGPDSEIANILAKGINRKLHIQTNLPIGNDVVEHIGEFDFGHNFYRQYPNERWILEHEFEFSGALGECLCIPEYYSDDDIQLMKNPRLEVIIEKLLKKQMMSKTVKKQYVQKFTSYIESRYELPRGKSLSECQQSELSQALAGDLGGDSMYNSGAQAMCYFYSLFTEWHFNHFINDISFKVREGRKLSIALIKDLDSELASLPFVSRCFTRRNSVQEIDSLPVKYKTNATIKKCIPNVLINIIFMLMGRKAFNTVLFDEVPKNDYKQAIDLKTVFEQKYLYKELLEKLYSIEVIKQFLQEGKLQINEK